MPGAGLKGWGLFLLAAGLVSLGAYYAIANNMTYADVVRLSMDRNALNMFPVWFYGSIATAVAGFLMWLVGMIVGSVGHRTVYQRPSNDKFSKRYAQRQDEPIFGAQRMSSSASTSVKEDAWSHISVDGISIRYREIGESVEMNLTGSRDAFAKAGRLFNPLS